MSDRPISFIEQEKELIKNYRITEADKASFPKLDTPTMRDEFSHIVAGKSGDLIICSHCGAGLMIDPDPIPLYEFFARLRKFGEDHKDCPAPTKSKEIAA